MPLQSLTHLKSEKEITINNSISMKKLTLIFCFCFIYIAVFSQEKEIRSLLEKQRQDWNAGNIEAYMQGYVVSDSLLFVGKNGPKYGYKNTLENYKKGYPNKTEMGFLTFNIQQIKIIDPNHAFVLGAWHLKREKDEPQGYFTLLLKKFKSGWRIIVDHSS
jgi:ketosteroid isomerase-like protein